MSVAENIQKCLDQISEQLWEIDVDDGTLTTLAEETLKLSAQIAIYQTLLNTARDLLKSNESPGPKTAVTRISKVFKATFGDPNGKKSHERWQKLQEMDCETFLFIAISYTDLELTKLHQHAFGHLMDAAPKFRIKGKLPHRWMFRKRIRLAVHGVAADDFLEKYDKLRYGSKTLQVEEEKDIGAQIFMGGSEHESQSLAHSRKRMYTGLEQEQPAAGTLSSMCDKQKGGVFLEENDHGSQSSNHVGKRMCAGLEHEQLAATSSPLLYDETRKMQSIYTNAPASSVSRLPEPFRTFVQNSQLWKQERSQNLETTGCMAILFPQDYKQDVSCTIWCGHNDGYSLAQTYGQTCVV